tara:strand:+ start:25 stop:2997 length:2973 start_codon:yes stop_codon:yes gene_type:complete
MSFNKRVLSPGATPFVNNENFRVVTYTGNGGSQSITGVGFQPDFVWHKARSSAHDHNLTDSTRGVKKGLNINDPRVEGNQDPYGVTSFDSDGFTVNDNSGGGASVNGNGITYVAWCWKGGGGATSNSDGSITSTVNANPDAGFSIVKYTGTGSSGSVGHGLNSDPKLIINKRISQSADWLAGAVTWTKYLEPNGTPPFRTANVWTDTQPTSTTFGVINSTSASSVEYINYCFADVAGYQKIATYTGTGAAGNFVNTGFEPAFVLIKNLDNTAGWLIFDNKRNATNPRNNRLEQNNNQAEQTGSTSKFVNFYSTGFEPQVSDSETNANGDDYLYWAIAANPDETTPTLANSFNIEIYQGNQSTKSITGLGFSPNFIWLKERSGTDRHVLIDTLRGEDSQISTNNTDAETTYGSNFDGFDTDGFTLGSATETNDNGEDYVAWTWKADDGEPTYNTNGTVNSMVTANANAGFSIVKATAPSSGVFTVGHGLSSALDFFVIKRLDSSGGWIVYSRDVGANKYLLLNDSASAATDTTFFNNTDPTSTVFTLKAGSSIVGGAKFVAYCFSEVSNYQQFGTYTGNNTNDTAITTGFQPDFVLIKSITTAENWSIMDSRRGGHLRMYTNTNDDDENTVGFRFSSNGFVIPKWGSFNHNGATFFYWALAKNVSSINTVANSFKTKTYTGTGSAQSITGLGFKPDLTWFKDRGRVREHILSDSIRGAGREISPNTADAEETDRGVGSFDSDGFSFADGNTNYNASSENYVAWTWKAGNQWQLNTNGSINSTINANTGNGFSIVKYVGTGSATTVGHGLSSAPEMIIVKNLSNSHSGNAHWAVYNTTVGATKVIYLNRNNAEGTSSAFWNDTAPTTSVFSIGTDNDVNVDGEDFIAYCWHSVSGYSKIGTYTGNSSTRSITGVGFQPDWLMIKQTNAANHWRIFDSARGLGNPQTLFASLDSQEDNESNTVSSFDSDGWTMGSQQGVNDNGDTYIYMAFKE